MAEIAAIIAILIVWILILLPVFKNVLCIRAKVVNDYFSKKIVRDKSAVKNKYLIEIIFSKPRNKFVFQNTNINFEIIHNVNTRLATLSIDCNVMTKNLNLCCVQEYRSYWRINRAKPLPVISNVRVYHTCSEKDAEIYVRGIEVHDQKNGDIIFYSIERPVYYNDDKRLAPIYPVINSKMLCCSKQALTPSFMRLNVEDFGRPLYNVKHITESNRDMNVNDITGVLVSPKLNCFETLVFQSFFIILTFVLSVAILCYLQNKINHTNTIVTAIFFSGLFAYILTESLAIIYREHIKYYYNKKCSPMKVEEQNSSKVWPFIRFIYLFTVFLWSIVASILIYFIINYKNEKRSLSYRYDFKIVGNSVINEISFLLLILFASLMVCLTVWFVMFGIIRFIWHSINRYSARNRNRKSDIEMKDNQQNQKSNKHDRKKRSSRESSMSASEASESSKESVQSPRKQKIDKNINLKDSVNLKNNMKRKGEKTSSDTSVESTTSAASTGGTKRKKARPKDSGQYELSTQYLEKNLSDANKRRLQTTSFIAKPTPSLGYINPEQFRLTNSTLQLEENSKTLKKKTK